MRKPITRKDLIQAENNGYHRGYQEANARFQLEISELKKPKVTQACLQALTNMAEANAQLGTSIAQALIDGKLL